MPLIHTSSRVVRFRCIFCFKSVAGGLIDLIKHEVIFHPSLSSGFTEITYRRFYYLFLRAQREGLEVNRRVSWRRFLSDIWA